MKPIILHSFFRKCEFCEEKRNLIVWTYHDEFFGIVISPTAYLCNYHYRRAENINHDDFTQRINTSFAGEKYGTRYYPSPNDEKVE